MKILKRNAVIITVLLFVGVAVYLNWSYGKQQSTDTVSNQTQESGEGSAEQSAADASASAETGEDGADAGLYYGAGKQTDAAAGAADTADTAAYFAQVRLSRQQARDEATQTLSTVSETEGASQDTVDEALAQIMQIAAWTTKEAELESMITSKGFSDCIVFMTEDGVTVTVAVGADGLSTAGAAQITDIVTGETDFTAADIKIVEIK